MDWYKKSPDSIQTLKSTAIGSGAVVVQMMLASEHLRTSHNILNNTVLVRIEPQQGIVYLLGYESETRSLIQNQGLKIDFSILRKNRQNDEAFSNEICKALSNNKFIWANSPIQELLYQIDFGPIIPL